MPTPYRRRQFPSRPSTSSNNDRHIRAGTKRVVALMRQHMEANGLQIYDIASELRCTESYVLALLSHRANWTAKRTEDFADALRMVPGSPEREAFIEAGVLSALDDAGVALVDRLRA